MDLTILEESLIMLAVAVFAVSVFRRFRLPAILAYLAVGAFIGPHGSGWVTDHEDIHVLAEFGVVFLLFTVGLEFTFPQLLAMKKELLGVGSAQVVVTTLVAALVAWKAGVPPGGAFVVGGVIALSSTAIVSKLLTERAELGSRHGRLSIGVLLFQDAAVIPFLIVIAALSTGTGMSVPQELAWALAKGVVVIAVMLAAGRWLLRPLFHEIASSRSSELFTLTVLLLTLAAAWLTNISGLSLALGAFLAGMVLAETEFRHQVESDIRPFRDVLLGLFFITVGMLLDVSALPAMLHWVLLLVAVIVLGKALIIVILARLMGITLGVAVRTAAILAQGGEFGFALVSLAFAAGILDNQTTQLLLASVIFTMALAPLLIQYNGLIAKYICGESYLRQRREFARAVEEEARRLRNHTIICGYGRIGQNLTRFLDHENREYIALDLDPTRVRDARAAGERVNYGDAARPEILRSAGIDRAMVVVITFEDIHTALKIMQQVRQIRPDIPLLVRTRDESNLDRLLEAGATEVIPDSFEVSVMIASHLLYLLQVPVSRIVRQVQNVHDQRFQMLREVFHGEEVGPLEDFPISNEHLKTVILESGAHAIGRRLADYDFRELDVVVTAIRRGGIRAEKPAPDMLLREDDALILYGPEKGLMAAEKMLLRGPPR